MTQIRQFLEEQAAYFDAGAACKVDLPCEVWVS